MRQPALTLLAALTVAGCATGPVVRGHTLEYVDGELVSTRPVRPAAYEHYLRAQLALEAGDLADAEHQIDAALRNDPGDPHLHTVRGQIHARQGALAQARDDATRALRLSPGYPPAKALLAEIDTASNQPALADAPSPNAAN